MAEVRENQDAAEHYEEFLRLFARERERVFAYIYSLIPRQADAEDVFQQCSLVLWRKFDSFDRQASFLAWACGVARLEVCNYLRTAGRDRLHFDDELVQQLAARRVESLSQHDDRLAALRTCLKELTQQQRALIDAAYGSGGTVKRLAEATGSAVQTLYNRLGRLRRRLLECVQRKLAAAE